MAVKLGVRVQPKGGPVAPQVRPEPNASPQELSAARVVLLIHGFNNSAERAERSYRGIEARLRSQLRGYGTGRLGAIWQFYWPGDQVGRLPVLGQIRGYRESLDNALETGRLLAAFLEEHRHQQICVIGHSMGCRVTLEMMRSIDESPSLRSWSGGNTAFLLAAAVPEAMCREPSGTYPHTHSEWSERVIWSRNDRILHYLFPLGQPREPLEGGPAVGYTGGPTGRWSSSSSLPLYRTRADPLRLGHSQYWGSKEVARRIATLLGLLNVRFLPAAEIPATTLDEERLEDRPLIRRELPSRTE
jgi:pimeloyl-ACP methyl ester carboxylesterase